MWYCEPIASLTGAHTYCAKEETRVNGPWTFGELPADLGRGHRSDLDHDGALALQGDLDSISISTRMRYDRGVAALYKEGNRLRWSRKEREVEVHILWGKPGTGKSRAFTNMYDYPFKGIKFKRDGTIWFDGYREERAILIEEMAPGKVSYSELLQICDRYPYQIEVKGGTLYAAWTVVCITSNYDPKKWFPGEDFSALARRITSCTRCTEVAGNIGAPPVSHPDLDDELEPID